MRLLVSKAVGDRRVLQQGDRKNAFCNATIPNDERIAVRPPVGDPAYKKDEYWYLKKMLYYLRRSPHHWYNMFTDVLKAMGLAPSLHNPCLFDGVVVPQAAEVDPTSVAAKVILIVGTTMLFSGRAHANCPLVLGGGVRRN